MTANKWYCIAQSSTFDSSCGITIYSEGVAVSFTASVRFGSSSINIASCAIDGDILLSVRLRETDNKWCIDLLCNTEFNPTIDITDSPYWEVQNTPAGTGSVLAIINDISKEFNTGIKGGESLWQLFNFGTQEKPEYAVVPKDYDGKPIGVVSKTFISFGGHNSGAEEGTGGGITTFDVYIGNDGPYSLVNGRVDLPAYPTANLTGYATENWVKEQGYLTQHQDISHLLGKEEAKDIYATIIALNEVSDRVETIESIIGIDSKGNVYIKKKADGTARDFYTYGAISFGGNGENSGSGEVIGSSVQYNASVTSGKLLGTLVIDGVDNKIYAPAIPTKLSAFTNDEGYVTEDWVDKQGFLTAHQSLTHLLSKEEAADTYQPKGNYVTESALNGKGYLTQSDAEDTYQPKGDYAVLDDLNSYLLASTAKNTYATIQALNGATTRISTLETTLSTEQGYIDTLQGYFTSGKANKAIADGNGNNIVDTYATKVALNSTNTNLASLSKEFSEFKELVNNLWYLDTDHADTVRTKLNVVVEQAISFGGYGEGSSTGGGGLTSFKVKVGEQTYNSVGDTVSIPAYPTKASLGLNNVENTAISTWTGSSKITTLGTVTSGTWNGSKIANNYLANSSITISGTSVSLGGSITQSALRTALGLGSLAYKSSLVVADIPNLSSKYLSLNGGTVTGDTTFENNLYIGSRRIKYTANDDMMRVYGPIIIAGDEDDGSSTNTYRNSPLLITSVSDDSAGLSCFANWNYKMSLIWNTSNGSCIYDATNRAFLGIGNDGVPHFNKSALTHKGNIVSHIANAGNISIGGHLSPSLVHTYTLGTSALPWNVVYTRYIDTCSGYDLRFRTGATEQMRIAANSGNVIIGGSSVAENANYKLLVSGDQYNNGNIVATGAITFGSASDRRLKDNIKSMTDKQAVAVLSALNPVTFNWNSTAYELGKLSGISDGFIADEYEKLIPNSGRDIWANYRAINYERATGYLVKGWQKHQSEIERLKDRVKELENELKQYRRA